MRAHAPFALAVASFVSVLALTWASPAKACGGSGPGGTGACEFRLEGPRQPRIGASLVLTDTTMLFGEGRRAKMQRGAAFASLSLPTSRASDGRVTFEVSLGGLFAGSLDTGRSRSTLGPGAVTALGLNVRALDGKGSAPLLVLGVTASSSFARIDPDGSQPGSKVGRTFEAYDVRGSALLGKTIANVVTPFLLARAFGGPAFWRFDDGARVQGTDLYKYQLGGGVALSVDRFDLFVEAAPLGERNLAAGLGLRL